jgi:hypothetical protein
MMTSPGQVRKKVSLALGKIQTKVKAILVMKGSLMTARMTVLNLMKPEVAMVMTRKTTLPATSRVTRPPKATRTNLTPSLLPAVRELHLMLTALMRPDRASRATVIPSLIRSHRRT